MIYFFLASLKPRRMEATSRQSVIHCLVRPFASMCELISNSDEGIHHGPLFRGPIIKPGRINRD
jgi:hypothetical protein